MIKRLNKGQVTPSKATYAKGVQGDNRTSYAARAKIFPAVDALSVASSIHASLSSSKADAKASAAVKPRADAKKRQVALAAAAQKPAPPPSEPKQSQTGGEPQTATASGPPLIGTSSAPSDTRPDPSAPAAPAGEKWRTRSPSGERVRIRWATDSGDQMGAPRASEPRWESAEGETSRESALRGSSSSWGSHGPSVGPSDARASHSLSRSLGSSLERSMSSERSESEPSLQRTSSAPRLAAEVGALAPSSYVVKFAAAAPVVCPFSPKVVMSLLLFLFQWLSEAVVVSGQLKKLSSKGFWQKRFVEVWRLGKPNDGCWPLEPLPPE